MDFRKIVAKGPVTPMAARLVTVFMVLLMGCQSAYLKSVGGDPDKTFYRIYPSSYTLVWDSALEVFKTTPLETVNRENGSIETQWVDNTSEKNLLESSGNTTPYNKARYKFKVILNQGFYDGRESVRVAVTKLQQVERDVLEGFRDIDTDGVQERTLLYRMGQIVAVKKKLGRIENERIRRQLREAKAAAAGTGPGDNKSEPRMIPLDQNDKELDGESDKSLEGGLDIDAPPPEAPEN